MNMNILPSPDYKVLFMESPSAWSAANGGAAYPSAANHFHFYRVGDTRVEFESDGLMQFYIEAGVGKDAWYGTQDGPNHRWSFGHDASDGFDWKFCGNVFGIDHNYAKFVIRQNATVYPGSLGTATTPAYTFDDQFGDGLFSPGDQNVAISTGGVEAVRFTHSSTQNMRLWSGPVGTGGMHVIAIPNGAMPSTAAGGGQLVVIAGALWFVGGNGTSTKLANA
jgi:hypothetical protein